MTQLGGAERVAGRLARHFPDAVLLTTAYRPDVVPLDAIGGRPWGTTFIQPLQGRLGLKAMLPLLPLAAASLLTGGHELLVSSSSAFGHHARRDEGALHVCLCHTPPRFLWQPEEYFRGRSRLQAALAPLLLALRRLDQAAARRVDSYVAVSEHIARRIRSVYGRDARVVYPPVDVSSYTPSRERSGRFLVLSRLVPSKRVELVIEAATRFDLPLDVIGTGPEFARLNRIAGPTVRMLGWQSDETVRDALARCEAVVIAGEEDFGLVAVEAQASGRPPVAFASGGSLETVEDGVTGHLFREQTPEVIAEALQRARDSRADVASLRESALRFDLPRFYERLDAAIACASVDQAAAGPSRLIVSREEA